MTKQSTLIQSTHTYGVKKNVTLTLTLTEGVRGESESEPSESNRESKGLTRVNTKVKFRQ